MYGNEDIVSTLLSVLPNTDVTDDDKRTQIETATFNGIEEVISCFSLLALTDTVSLVTNDTEASSVNVAIIISVQSV